MWSKVERIFGDAKWQISNSNESQYTFTLGEDYKLNINIPDEIFTLTQGSGKEKVTIAKKDPKTLKYQLRREGEDKLVREDELMRMLTYLASDPVQYVKDMSSNLKDQSSYRYPTAKDRFTVGDWVRVGANYSEKFGTIVGLSDEFPNKARVQLDHGGGASTTCWIWIHHLS